MNYRWTRTVSNCSPKENPFILSTITFARFLFVWKNETFFFFIPGTLPQNERFHFSMKIRSLSILYNLMTEQSSVRSTERGLSWFCTALILPFLLLTRSKGYKGRITHNKPITLLSIESNWLLTLSVSHPCMFIKFKQITTQKLVVTSLSWAISPNFCCIN